MGKTTFLSRALPGWKRVDLEEMGQIELFDASPDLFLRDHPDHVWFDEVQRLPDLLPAVLEAVDLDPRPGRFVLSASSAPALLTDAAESLRARVGILELGPLSAAEQLELPAPDFVETILHRPYPRELRQLLTASRLSPDVSLRNLWLRGGYAGSGTDLDPLIGRWFDAYVETVSSRELQAKGRELTSLTVARLLRMAAGRQGQPINSSAVARDLGVTNRTADRYLSAIESAFLWRRLSPYLAAVGKRLVRRPRAGLVDSGLLHHLLQIRDLDSLDHHPLQAASWKAWVTEQLIRQGELLDPPPAPFHWRTQAGAEVDLLFETTSGRLLPFVIRHTSRISPLEVRGLRQFLGDFADRVPFGVVIYRGQEVVRMATNLLLVPVETAILPSQAS